VLLTWDRNVSLHILTEGQDAHAAHTRHDVHPGRGDADEEGGGEDSCGAGAGEGKGGGGGGGGGCTGMGKLWDLDKLQMYIAWVKQTLQPRLTPESILKSTICSAFSLVHLLGH